jgi:hypothetical protein
MTAAPTSTLPGMSLYASATNSGKIREIWIFNTTVTQCNVALQRITTAGTQGAALTEVEYDESGPSPTLAGFNSHTSTPPTLGTGLIAMGMIGAAYGAAVVWSFGDTGLVVPATANNGIGITCPNGTGQVCDVVWVWDE